MDDEAFLAAIGETDDGTDPATPESSAADETAIEAAVPDEGDVPDDEGAESPDELEAESDEETEKPEAAPEVIPISDQRHPDHAIYLEAQQAKMEKARVQATIAELARMQEVHDIRNTIEGLPDTDPDKLIPTVQNLIAKIATPLRQQAFQHAQEAEEAAGIATTLHLAMKAMLPGDWVAALEAKSRELGKFGTWEAASHIVSTEKQAAARESAELKAAREENATLRKQLKAQGRDPNADRVPAVHPSATPGRAPATSGSKFDQFFDAEILGLG